MKWHNPDNSGPVECTAPAWDLLPWYVNGALAPADAEQVRRHYEVCNVCTADISNLRHLATHLRGTDTDQIPIERSWSNLRAQIEADERAPTAATSKWIGKRLFTGRIALAGAATAACLVVAVQLSQRAGADFWTLTSDTIEAKHLVRFQTVPDLTREQLSRILKAHGAVLVSGPTQTGTYITTVGEDADTRATADAFMARPDIVFATPENSQ